MQLKNYIFSNKSFASFLQLPDIEFMEWGLPPMMVDDDYMQLMSDTLFSTISNQAFAFPDSREIGEPTIF